MKKYILMSYTENGLQLEGVFDTHKEARDLMGEIFSTHCEEYDGEDEYDAGDQWIGPDNAYSYANEWLIAEAEV